MPNSPRAEALALVKSGEIINPPCQPDYQSGSPEALEFIEGLKSVRFANLAQTIGLMLDTVFEQTPAKQPDGLMRSSYQHDDFWLQLSADTQLTFYQAQKRIIGDPAYGASKQFSRLTGTMHPHRHIHIDMQLMAGTGTSISTMLTLLRNLPQVVDYHAPYFPKAELGDIARRSTNLPRKLAKICVNQMMAAQHSLSVESDEEVNWSGINTVLDPNQFDIQYLANGERSITYKSLPDMTVPEGYSPHSSVDPVEEETRVEDITCSDSVIIGCPITLLEGKLPKLWDMYINAVEQRGLWEESYPKPFGSEAIQ
jgi:hypothetical protein